MATNNNKTRLQSVGGKPPIHTFSKPQQSPSKSRAPQKPSKLQLLEDFIGHLSNEERLSFELDRFGYFTFEDSRWDRWTQAEIDTEWARQIAAKTPANVTERSPAFALNWDFKPQPEPQYIIVNDDDHLQPSKPVISQYTPSNYWNEWRAREGIVERHFTHGQYGEELRQRLASKKAESIHR